MTQEIIEVDPKHLTGTQLNNLKYMGGLYNAFKQFLPYTAKNGIRFVRGDLNDITVCGMGYTVVNNSYNKNNDYGLIIEIQRIRHIPEAYRSRIYVKEFSIDALEEYADAIMVDNKRFKNSL